ncbi:RNA methyltransferase [Pontivivens insulae]|uniref:tRNA (cytidine/uridine-2'-O-)-methyltransferase TrmJ n=1 Tax=Pontivivens insulae TaxID=1639689 RepID=A0A2R8ABL1_9RHOB|nr:RNA methyltransferase [Pontivivens insulae]RED11225.1 tRNA/rRNA methyltransferase [Pontivivens insulae]SPF29602.1 putative tRNA/rRNA methyltransferase [Pontivivens insulae]
MTQTPAFILVRPQMGENIGAAARAMLNFGLDRMRIVGPRDGWPNERAVALASGAGRVLDAAMVRDELNAVCEDLNYVFATTARARDLTKPVMTPERAMEHARALTASGQKVGVMFGPERAGLENEDIVRADAIISVPVNPEFPSLNLAQCVLLTAYEWKRQDGDVPPEVLELAGARLAEGQDVDKLLERLVTALDARRFFWPEHKADSMRANLENMLRRLPLTETDTRTLHGVIRHLADRPVRED